MDPMDFPDDIRALLASRDDLWPLLPLADRPVRVDFWLPHSHRLDGGGYGTHPDAAAHQADLCERFKAAGVPFELRQGARDRAWFHSKDEAAAVMPQRGPADSISWGINDDSGWFADPRDHVTLVLEYILANGTRHLHIKDDWRCAKKGVRYIFLDGNWSHDCNRADEVVSDGVQDHGFELDADGSPVNHCTHTITLGWAVLRHRSRATGEVRFEPAIEPGEDGRVSSLDDQA